MEFNTVSFHILQIIEADPRKWQLSRIFIFILHPSHGGNIAMRNCTWECKQQVQAILEEIPTGHFVRKCDIVPYASRAPDQ